MHTPPLVLLVDDEADFREIFSTKLRAAGFQVEVARDGVEGVAQAKALEPDLILMDLKMPNMDGVEALIKIHDDPAMRDTKVLFLTAYGEQRPELQEIDRRYAKEVGAVGYLKKSEDLDTAIEYVKHFLQ